jgi:hypothetical protein
MLRLGFCPFHGQVSSLQPPACALKEYIPAKSAGTFPYGDDVLYRMLSRAVGRFTPDKILTESFLVLFLYFDLSKIVDKNMQGVNHVTKASDT